MADEPDYILEIGSLDSSGVPPQGTDASAAANDSLANPRRNWIGVRFECCGVYTRVYRNRQGSAYEGACPKCSRILRVGIGPGGTDDRLFRAS